MDRGDWRATVCEAAKRTQQGNEHYTNMCSGWTLRHKNMRITLFCFMESLYHWVAENSREGKAASLFC